MISRQYIDETKTRNPDIEIRNKPRDKKSQIGNPKTANPNEAGLEFLSVLVI